jgi:hypothetical protein
MFQKKMLLILLLTPFLSKSEPLNLGGICTNNRPSNSYQEYLKYFNEGPCSPVIFSPGLSGSGLLVVTQCKELINAAKFNADAKKAMELCPFMCEDGNDYYEKMIWVTKKQMIEYVGSTDFNFVWKNRECASFLFSVKKKAKLNENGEVEKIEDYEIPGVRIKIYGNTEETKGDSQCGRKALTSFYGEEATLYAYFMRHFDKMGYINGLTMQTIPFDFRRRPTENHFPKNMRLSLKIMKYLTGKRTVILGHSFGNNMVINGLKRMKVQEKDALVREYIAIGAPFLGSLDTLFFIFGDAGWFNFNLQKIIQWDWLADKFNGINAQYAQQLYPYIDSMYEMIPRIDQIRKARDTVLQNQQALVAAGIPFPFIHNSLVDADYLFDHSIIHQRFTEDLPKEYKLEETKEAINKFGFSDFIEKYYAQFDFDAYSINENPETPTRVVFITELFAPGDVILLEDPKKKFAENDFPQMRILSGKGDGTINIYSLGLAPLMWFNEYLRKVTTNPTSFKIPKNSPRKISFVEFGRLPSKKISDHYEYIQCHDKNDWDDEIEEEIKKKREEIEAKKNKSFWHYIGKGVEFIKNSFKKKNDTENKNEFVPFGSRTCNHSSLVINKQFIEYLQGILSSKDSAKEAENPRENVVFKEQVLKDLLYACPVVRCEHDFDSCWHEFLKIMSTAQAETG